MERDEAERPLADGTGMDRPDDVAAMRPGDEESRKVEATGGEKTAVEGVAGIAATHRNFGAQMPGAVGGIGTHVPTDADEHQAQPQEEGDEQPDSTDPRGY